ncbi:MAG: ADP-ribosylation family protein [Janthinobacterium lividum]
MTEEETRRLLKDAYRIDFPDNLFQFWDFTKSFGEVKPLDTFTESMGFSLDGPFKFLAGNPEPVNGWYLDARYYDDPPEFITVFSGDTDGHHWGYWFDDPDNSPIYSIADYYSKDAYEITENGKTLFEAFRLHLERCYGSTLENIETDPDAEEYQDEYQADLEVYTLIRTRLMQFSTTERLEISSEYVERYAEDKGQRAIAAETLESMGIVVPDHLYRPLSVDGGKLREIAVNNCDLSVILAEAYKALEEGFPGSALELGRNLWIGNPTQKQEAYRLLEKAYTALSRPTLAHFLVKIIPTRLK